MINVVLVEPEIPQNTGNISRTCACTGTALHLVRPYGFELSDRTLKRAGLDYWDKLNVTEYDSLDDVRRLHPDAQFFYLTTRAKHSYTDVKYPDGCFLVFGKETKGLPDKEVDTHPDTSLRIPMSKNLRCLNLSNSVAVVVYEALRQQGFPELF